MTLAGSSAAPASLAGVALYTMFRGDPRQLLQWCNFHLTAGAEHLYVVLDGGDAATVAALPSNDRISWHRAEAELWDAFYPRASQNVEQKQVDGFRWMARLAAQAGHAFAAFVDADELLWLTEPFTALAAAHPDAQAFVVPVKEMWYADDDPITEPFGATLALRRSTRRGVGREKAFGWRAQFLRNGLMGHSTGKTVYRLPLAAGDLSVHRFRPGAARERTVTLPAEAGGVLHFDCGNLTTWNAKWGARLQGDTIATGLGPHRQAQQQLFSHTLRKPAEEQEAFFRRFYSLDPAAQQILTADGSLERLAAGPLVDGPLAVAAPDAPELVRLPSTAERVDFQLAMVCDRRFVRPTFATMLSVLAQLGDRGTVRFVVLGDGLAPSDVLHLRSLEHTRFDVEVMVHDITGDLDRDVGTEDKKRATFGRIYLIDYLPEQRTIYLDGDVLATRDFSELFDRDLGGACLAGVPDSAAFRIIANPAGVPTHQRTRLLGITHGDPLDYLNGGVLIFDLDNPRFRDLALDARGLVVTQGRALKQRDQDATNIAFSGSKHRLESTYNYMTQFYASDRVIDGDLIRRKYDNADATLVHFSGRIKPWEEPDDEFYNGLYRRLVSEAEEKVGASCGFYFSRRSEATASDWSAERWTETLRIAAPRPSSAVGRVADIEVLELTDDAAYLTVGADMLALIAARGLRLSGFVAGEERFSVPLDGLSAPYAHLVERVGRGVRRLPLDLAAALATDGGVVRGLELAVTAATTDRHDAFSRSLGSVELLAAGSAATPALLTDLGVDGALETLSGGWLKGWYRPRGKADAVEPLAVYVDGELAVRRVARGQRDGLPDGTFGFRFNVGNLRRLGYGRGGIVTVRVGGHNVPLRGAPVPLDAGRDLVYDAERDRWEALPDAVAAPAAPASRARRLAGRVKRRVVKES